MNELKNDYQCYNCNRQVTVIDNQKVSFRESCLGCRSDLHVCKNCCFYNPTLNNQCSENQAEPVADKEKNNRCEYFRFNTKSESSSEPVINLIKKLDDLFK